MKQRKAKSTFSSLKPDRHITLVKTNTSYGEKCPVSPNKHAIGCNTIRPSHTKETIRHSYAASPILIGLTSVALGLVLRGPQSIHPCTLVQVVLWYGAKVILRSPLKPLKPEPYKPPDNFKVLRV